MAEIPKLSAGQIIRALRGRFASPEHAFLEQVANGTGVEARRYADAVAVGIWPSRGLLIHGFEIKISRTDWKTELKNPRKSEPVQQYCDHWWICAPRGLIDKEELPATWGLIEVNEKVQPHTLVVAPKLEALPLDRKFMAAVIRRHSDVWEKVLRRETVAAREDGEKTGDPGLAGKLEMLELQHKTLLGKVEAFEKASGIQIQYGWRLGEVGKAVELLANSLQRDSMVAQLEKDLEAYQTRAALLKKDIAALRSVETPRKAAG